MATTKKANASKAEPKSTFDPSKLNRKVITLPLFKWKDAQKKFLKITSAVFEGKAVAGKEGKDMEPANLCNCINLETGEEGQVIIGAVLAGVFEDNFTGDEYVGRMFEIEQYKVEGKRYKGYKVNELSE